MVASGADVYADPAVIKLSPGRHVAVIRGRYESPVISSLAVDEPTPLAGISSAAGWRHQPSARWLPVVVLLAPSLIFLAAFTYLPVLRVIGESLLVGRFAGQTAIGFGNYTRLFADRHFGQAAWNNLVYAVGTIGPSLVLALALALALRETTRVNRLLRTLVVMPLMIPLVAAAALFSFILLPGDGLLDFYLSRFGLGMVNWLGDPDLALGAVIAITVWKNTGYYMLFFLAGLAGVSQDVVDAARIDGAGAFRRLRSIVLPLLGPTFGFVVPIALVNALTQIDHVVTLTQGGPSDATNLLLYYTYQQAAQNYDFGLASAATVISVAALLALSLISFRALDHGIHYES
jgi:sn-glycerol 3-phosphate transport system permease protein